MRRQVSISLIVLVAVLVGICPASAMDCGDVNGDLSIDVADVVYLVAYMFDNGPPPPYIPGVDFDGDSMITISDLVRWVDWSFTGGPILVCSFTTLSPHLESSSGCLPQMAGMSDSRADGYMFVEVVNGVMRVRHIEAFYQCCLEYTVDWNLAGQTLTGFERDTGFECDCICYFNLNSEIEGLDQGEYTVVLMGIYGDTVGVQTVTINGDTPSILSYSDSGCLPQPPPASPVLVEYSLQADTLMMTHGNAEFNAGAIIVVDFALVGDTLRFYERNISGDWQPTTCFFEISAAVRAIAPGDYIAEIYSLDAPDPTDPFVLIDRRPVELSNPIVIDYGDSGCLRNSVDTAEVVITYNRNGDTLFMHMHNGYFNCGGIIASSVQLAGDTLRFYEANISDQWAWCMCYFDATATVLGLPSGTYTAEVYTRDWPEDPYLLVDRQVLDY